MTEERAAYDPSAGLIDLKGRAYLPVAARIVWFRHEHPEGTIETIRTEYDPERGFAVFRAEICTGQGGRATATGSETARDFGDYLEKAETKAVGRALGYLGYGTAAAFDEGERVVDAPQPRPAPRRQPTRAREARGDGAAGTDAPAPAPARDARTPQPPTPLNAAGGTTPPAATPAGEPEGSKAYRALVTWAWTLVEDGKSIREVEAFLNDKGDALSDDEFALAQREFRAMRARIRERDAAAERQLAGASS